MDEKYLDEIFKNSLITFAKVRLIGIYNFNLYTQFPLQIPLELREKFTGGLNKVRKGFEEKTEESIIIEQDVVDFIKASHTLVKFNELKSPTGLDQIILRQELITYFAYLEGYFQDLHKFILNFDHSLLSNKDKMLSWEEILTEGNYESIIQSMIEKKLEKSGFIKIYELIEIWNKPPFQFSIKVKKDQLRHLKKYTLIRNIIIHNNSKVTKELAEHNPSALKEGDLYLLNFEEIFHLNDFINWLLFETFSSIKHKFFKSDYNVLCDEYDFVNKYSPES